MVVLKREFTGNLNYQPKYYNRNEMCTYNWFVVIGNNLLIMGKGRLLRGRDFLQRGSPPEGVTRVVKLLKIVRKCINFASNMAIFADIFHILRGEGVWTPFSPVNE